MTSAHIGVGPHVKTLPAAIAAKKTHSTSCVRAPGRHSNFDHSQDLELTYTSNAIEGNTLSAAETTMVIEHGVTIGGKPLKDHLEAIDHFEALKFVRDRARADRPLSQSDLRNLHRLVVLRSHPDIAGRYADQGRYVVTDAGRHSFPLPAEVPALMGDFSALLGDSGARPRRRSPRTAASWTSTRSTTATGARLGC